MPTSIIPVTSTWQSIRSGPLDPLAVQATTRGVFYFLAASPPSASVVGHLLNPAVGHTITLTLGDNLYIRSKSAERTDLILTE